VIAAYHIIFTAYGFWLPNDPRGSGSDYVFSKAIYVAGGRATKTTERHSVAHRGHDRELRRHAKRALAQKPVRFTGVQARAIGRGFKTFFARTSIPVYACSILPDHIHLVIGKTRYNLDQLVIQLKGAAVRQMIAEERHPFLDRPDRRGRLPKCFVRGYWKVYLDPEAVDRSINYVEQNPTKLGMRKQRLSFVTEYSKSLSIARFSSAARHNSD
jgi:REP element-mobilizing transposase RayT